MSDGDIVSMRQYESYRRREKAAEVQTFDRGYYDVASGLTPDEDEDSGFPKFAASFNKLFDHDNAGLLTDDPGVTSYQALLAGLKVDTPNSDFDQDALNSIVLPNNKPPFPRVLINPQSSKAFSVQGGDTAAYDLGKLVPGYDSTGALLRDLSLRSGVSAAELIEAYLMALLRDTDFSDYKTGDATVDLALAALNKLGMDFQGPKKGGKIAPEVLFRGNSPGDLVGEYRSQFFLLRRGPLFPSGCATHVASLINAGIFFDPYAVEFTVPEPTPRGREFGVSWQDYLDLQNGKILKPYELNDFVIDPATKRGSRVVPRNGRHLAAWTNLDGPYEEYVWILDVLTGNDYARSPNFPYNPPANDPNGPSLAPNEGDGPTLGVQDAYALVGGILAEALKAVFAQKWLVARRARPEVMAALVYQTLKSGGATPYASLLDGRLTSPSGEIKAVLDAVNAYNKQKDPDGDTYLLSQVFPEGAPAHPAWPSAHATIAGACVTVIKAIFYDQQHVIDQKRSTPGHIVSIAAPDGTPLLLGQELDKFASNIALARSFAGVHYRSDGEHGILLGEEVAIRYLQDHARTYREEFRYHRGFILHKRSGQCVLITPTEVIDCPEEIEQRAGPRLSQKSVL